MKKSYHYEDLCKARAKWTSGLNVLVDHSEEVRVCKKKIRRRVVWSIVLLGFAVFFALALYFGEAQGDMTVGQILEAFSTQVSDTLSDVDTSGQPNYVGGVLATGLFAFIGLILILSAIFIRVKAQKFWDNGMSQKKEILNLQNTYLYDGSNYDLSGLKDTKADMDDLKQQTLDLFAALFIFRENVSVYQRNWLTKLAMDRVNYAARGLDDSADVCSRLMLEGQNTNWYVQVAALAAEPIVTAISMCDSSWDREMDFHAEAVFIAAYEACENLNVSQEDRDFLRVVKEVVNFLPGKLAYSVQNSM